MHFRIDDYSRKSSEYMLVMRTEFSQYLWKNILIPVLKQEKTWMNLSYTALD